MSDDGGLREELENVKKQCEQLKRECEERKRKASKYEENIKLMSKFMAGGRKQMKKRKKVANDAVESCLAHLDVLLSSDVWHRKKFLSPKWAEFQEGEKSTCQVLMAPIENYIPEMYVKEIFWHVHVVPYVARYYVTHRNSSTAYMKKVFASESY